MIKDVDVMRQREEVFDQYKSKLKELAKIEKEYNLARSKLTKVQKDSRSLKKLIDIMVATGYDPVEAKLKYSDKFEDDLDSGGDDDSDDLDMSSI